MGDRATSEHFAADCGTVFSALLTVIETRKYKVITTDRERAVVEFNTGGSISSWGGQNLTATLVVENETGTRLEMGGQLSHEHNPIPGTYQLFSWGEKGRLIDAVIWDVAKIVNAPAAWYGDPYGRFDGRWWDGRTWTDHVGRVDADGTRHQLEDPVEATPP